MSAHTESIAPLREFVVSMTELVSNHPDEATRIQKGGALLKKLIDQEGWLPEFCSIPHPQYYQQYLLHADPLERFSVVSFVWGPGQKTPVHDHCVWGLLGMFRGEEKVQRYEFNQDKKLIRCGESSRLKQGEIDCVSSTHGDIHVVENAFTDKTSIAIHVYGGNIGGVKRHVYDPETGEIKKFVSGYSSSQIPNLWDRSAVIRAQIS